MITSYLPAVFQFTTYSVAQKPNRKENRKNEQKQIVFFQNKIIFFRAFSLLSFRDAAAMPCRAVLAPGCFARAALGSICFQVVTSHQKFEKEPKQNKCMFSFIWQILYFSSTVKVILKCCH